MKHDGESFTTVPGVHFLRLTASLNDSRGDFRALDGHLFQVRRGAGCLIRAAQKDYQHKDNVG